MHKPKISKVVRAAGYEALFLLAEAVALSLEPTMLNANRLEQVFGELRERRNLEALMERGLVEGGGSGSEDVLRLTKLGRSVFEGGRLPEEAWERTWDGQWRLLTFDLPRRENKARLRFWRWLRTNHFGGLQGSVWITPHPVPSIERVAEEAGFDPSAVLVFTGSAGGSLTARGMAATAWDFDAINTGYLHYRTFAENALAKTRRKALPPERLRTILERDHQLWWQAVRPDPLLPKVLHPHPYEGMRAWKARQKLHKRLFRNLELPERS